jgi:tetratricopeptide (TPR) repeat protein
MATPVLSERRARMVHREFVGLIVLILACTIGLVLTRAAARSNREMHRNDAVRWYQQAQQSTAAARPTDAVAALRHAVAIDRDNAVYRLALAGALAAEGQDDAARQVLVNLRQLTPENPEINLQLARLEARRQNVSAAVGYYQNALHGGWPADHLDQRSGVRIELVEYLLRQGQRSRALSELLVFSSNLPDDAASQQMIGRLFLTAGEPGRALEHFNRALRVAPDDDARGGAAEAAFAAGDYARTRTYLRALRSGSPRLADLRRVVEVILTGDPLAARLKLDERIRRLHVGLEQLGLRLGACSAVAEPLRQELVDFAEAATPSRIRRDSGLIDQGVDLIGRAGQTAEERCGAGSATDRGWLAIAKRHENDSQ